MWCAKAAGESSEKASARSVSPRQVSRRQYRGTATTRLIMGSLRFSEEKRRSRSSNGGGLIPDSQFQRCQPGFKFSEPGLNQRTFFSSETMKWFSHEIVTDAQAGEGALDPFDDGGGMAADVIEGVAYTLNLRLQRTGLDKIAGAKGGTELHIELRKHIRATVHTAM